LTIVLSAVAFWLLFGVLQSTQWLVPKSRELRREDALEWNIRTVSTIHAIFLVYGAYLCHKDAQTYTRSGNVFGYSWPPDFFCRVFLGYIIYDLSNLSIFFKTLRDYSGMLHHALFIVVAAWVLAHSIFKYPFVWLALGEASTPFINLRWRLAVLGKKDSKAYLLNGVAMAVVFFLARVVANGLGLVHLWMIRDVWLHSYVPLGHRLCVLLFLAGYLLNLFWFTKIAQGVVRALSRPSPPKKHIQ